MDSKRKKIELVLSSLVFIFTVILISGSTSTYNYPVYRNFYLYDTFSGEILFGYLMKLFKIMGFEFKYFVFFLMAFGMILMNKTVHVYLKEKSWIFYVLFFIFPMGEAISALRNTILMFILVFAFPFLISGKRKDYMKYIFCILLASTIHRTSAFYLLLILTIPYRSKNFLSKTLKLFYIVIMILIVAMVFYPPFFGVAQYWLSASTQNDILFDSQNLGYFISSVRFGFLYFGFFHLATTFTVWKLIRYNDILKHNNKKAMTGDKLSFAKLVLFTDILLLVLIFGYKLNSNFFRLFMNILPLNYIAIIMLTEYLPKATSTLKMTKSTLVYSSFILILIAFSVYYIFPFFQYNVVPMFTSNWVIDMFLLRFQ